MRRRGINAAPLTRASARIVQNPTITLEGDVATTTRLIESQDGPVVLVGHS
jgi:hypothetical protein